MQLYMDPKRAKFPNQVPPGAGYYPLNQTPDPTAAPMGSSRLTGQANSPYAQRQRATATLNPLQRLMQQQGGMPQAGGPSGYAQQGGYDTGPSGEQPMMAGYQPVTSPPTSCLGFSFAS